MTYWGDPSIAVLTAAEDAHARRRYFDVLPYQERVAAIHRMAMAGESAETIARATGVAIAQIRALVGEVAA